MPIPEDIELHHVLQAIKDLDGGAAHSFGDSRDYDVVHEGNHYPPKAVVGLAAQHATGQRFGPEDFSGGEGAGQANRMLRKLGFKVERKRDVKPEWAASGEGAYRWDAWTVLGFPMPADEVAPTAIRNSGLYSGGQGIFVDKRRTSSKEFPDGITVSVLHTESVYADELSVDGILYHYPRTSRSGGRDAGEVQATKNTVPAGLPLVVIIRPSPSADYRYVRWGWVSDFDDTGELFYIQFQVPDSSPVSMPEAPFNPTAARSAKKRLATTRPGQAKFRFDVFKRYGSHCAFCGVDVQDLLEAAHIVAKQFDGCDDPRNGLVLCRNHHRALDKGFIAINPDTLTLEIRRGLSASELGVTRTSIAHLRAMPAPEALLLSYKADS